MKLLRFLMGIAVLSILLPATAMVLPNQMAAINPFDSDGSTGQDATVLAASGGGNESAGQDEASTRQPGDSARAGSGSNTGNPVSLLGGDPSVVDDTGSTGGGSEAEILRGQKKPHPLDDPDHPSRGQGRSNGKSGSNTKNTSTTSTAADPQETSTTANSDEDPPESVEVSGTITGTACPCTVTGVVELKGDVSLKGDLTVKGGILVARPGVNVNGNGHQIMFMAGGKADFQGTKTSTWSGNGSNANLSRDIQFKNLRRIVFHEGAGASILKYVSVIDTGVNGVRGDYPLHWHMNGNSTRGTLVEGVVVLNGRNHAFVPHASNGITFRNVIAKNTLEEAFWWDKPGDPPACAKGDDSCTRNDSHGIRVERLLVDGVNSTRAHNYELAGVQLGQGSGNVMTGAHVRNVASGTDCSAYHWPEDANGDWDFRGNTATTGPCDTAIFVWQNINNGGSRIDNFTTNGVIEHGAYRNGYAYDGVKATVLNSHAVSYTVRNSSFDEIVFFQHPVDGDPVRFDNVQANRVTVRDGNGNAGAYIFEGTNLTCANVVFAKPHPSSIVVINGQEC